MSWLNQLSGEDENDYIEVNKKYLEKLEKNSKELEVYKKAFVLACKELSFRDSPVDIKHVSAPRTVRYRDEFLKKAGEDNDT